MKPFTLTPKVKAFVERKYKRKARIIHRVVSEMERVMYEAVDSIMARAATGAFVEPNLDEMYSISEEYYYAVVMGGWETAEDEARTIGLGNARRSGFSTKLARIPKGAIPEDLASLEKLFRDKRAWPAIMKRSQLLTDRLRKAYLGKLKKKFAKLVPQMLSGQKTPEEVKAGLRDAWGASKSRVETIYRCETTDYFAETQLAYFKGDPDIIGFLFDSVRDSSRTDICRSRHGLIYRPDSELLKKNRPKLHFNCRSHMIALANTEHNRNMLADPDRDPTKRKVVPLPRGFVK